MCECIGEKRIEFSSVRWTRTPSNPSLNFEVSEQDGNIVINEHGGSFFIYAQVRAAILWPYDRPRRGTCDHVTLVLFWNYAKLRFKINSIQRHTQRLLGVLSAEDIFFLEQKYRPVIHYRVLGNINNTCIMIQKIYQVSSIKIHYCRCISITNHWYIRIDTFITAVY